MNSFESGQKNKFRNTIWFLLPAIVAVLVIFPVGIRTNLTSNDLRAHEADAPGPAMQLNDISSGFSRKDAQRPYSIFPSIAISTVYVPYIWARAGILPPYDLAEFADKHLPLIGELIVLDRGMNVLAALGIVILAFFIILMISGDLWASAFVSLAMALNPNLMFQSSVTYYENCAIFWVFLSLFFYMKLWMDEERPYLWIFAFSVCTALALSTHDRMGGYYILSFPALFFRMLYLDRANPGRVKRAGRLFLFSGIIGMIVFCLANNVFGAGLKPVYEYMTFKYSQGAIISDRMRSVWSFLRNQIGCHGHTLRLVFWNLGGVTFFISCLGAWSLWRRRYHPGLVLLLFPLGYQIMGVGLPGWTAGRYILGQILFVTLFSGFGVIWFLKNRPGLGKIVIVSALIMQFAIVAMVKISDIYLNPLRVVEKAIARDGSSAPVKRVGVEGFTQLPIFSQFPKTWIKNPSAKFVNLTGEETSIDNYDLIISRSITPIHRYPKCKREIFIDPPAWLIKLVRERCYLYSGGPSTLSIQWRDGL